MSAVMYETSENATFGEGVSVCVRVLAGSVGRPVRASGGKLTTPLFSQEQQIMNTTVTRWTPSYLGIFLQPVLSPCMLHLRQQVLLR